MKVGSKTYSLCFLLKTGELSIRHALSMKDLKAGRMIYISRKLLATGCSLSLNVCKILWKVQLIRATFLRVSTVAMEII